MPATVTLSTTTLLASVSNSAGEIYVASASGLTAGVRLFADRELMSVVSVGVNSSVGVDYTLVKVQRGVDGTTATPHNSGVTLYIGRGDQFYYTDPIGAPPQAIPVDPYINAIDGRIWRAQGDVLPDSGPNMWWQQVTTTYGIGSLGVRTKTEEPTSSS